MTELNYQAAMSRALELAALGQGKTGSNPVVGSVILDGSGAIIAEGFHAGADHAEVVAIKNAKEIPSGATIVVTLEPCNHTGKTGPCTEAIIAAGIKRVVFAVSDPNPIAAGGQEQLRAAGIEVIGGVLEEQARFVNRAWLSMIENNRPLFIWKIAATLDGKIAAQDGSSKWITGPAARSYVTTLRRQSDAILVGTGTVLADNPELIPHDELAQKNPLRVVVGQRELLRDLNIFDDRAELLLWKSHDISELATHLAKSGIKQVLVEAGATLGTALFEAGLIDEILLIQSPKLLGSGTPFIADLGISNINQARELKLLGLQQLENDFAAHLQVIPKAEK